MIREQNKAKTKLIKFTEKKGFRGFISILLAILIGIFFGFFIMLIFAPGDSFVGLNTIFKGFANSPDGIKIGFAQMLNKAMPVIFTGLAIAFAYQSGLFNIGASGQFTMGLLMATIVGIKGKALGGAQWFAAIILAMIAGFIWGSIPGILKSYFNVNEVISGIMLNYIAMFITNAILSQENGFLDNRFRTHQMPMGARTSYFGFDKIFPHSGLNFGFIMALIAIMATFLILSKTVFGYELKNVGANKHAARYAGIKEKRTIVLSVAISGLLAALGGALYMLQPGTYSSASTTYTPEQVILPHGFEGIAVAFLGLNNPIGLLFSSLFLSNLDIAGQQLQQDGFPKEMVAVITAVILYVSAFSIVIGNFFINSVINKNNRYKEKLKIIETKIDINEEPNVLYLTDCLNKKIFKTSNVETIAQKEEQTLQKQLESFIKQNNFPEEYNLDLLKETITNAINYKNFSEYPMDILVISTYNLLAQIEKVSFKKRDLISENLIDLEKEEHLRKLSEILNVKLFNEINPEMLKSLSDNELVIIVDNNFENITIPYELKKEVILEKVHEYINKKDKDFINYPVEILELAYPEMGIHIAKQNRKEKIRSYFNRFKIERRKEKGGNEK